jgi:amino acid transporter
LARSVVIVATLSGLAVVNVGGVRRANGFNAAMTVAKLAPLALFILVGMRSVRPTNLAWTAAPTASAVSGASAVLIFAFLGVEGALVPSGEVRNPARTVPRAIGLAIVGVTIVYLCVQLVAQSALGASLAQAKTPVADAAGVVLGPWGRTLILVGMSISMFGYLSGVTLAIPRMLFAFARDGFLPARLATVHPRHRTPAVAIVVQSGIAVVLAATGTWEQLAYVANGAILVVYAVCCIATLQLRRRAITSGVAPFIIPGGRLVPLLALTAVLWILSGVPLGELTAVVALVVVAALVYLATAGARLSRQVA